MIWHLLGAGSIGSLAAYYLQKAGFEINVLPRPFAASTTLTRQLSFSHKKNVALLLSSKQPSSIRYLLVATKAAQTFNAISPWLPYLDQNVTLISLQNGLGQWEQITLPKQATLVTAITQSGANQQGEQVRVVAENTTVMGSGAAEKPDWFDALQTAWPKLEWRSDIQQVQWQKLAVNAVINPLTATLRCANGELLNERHLPLVKQLAQEVDTIFSGLDSHWPCDTFERSIAVAKLTSANISSMLADVLASRATEIAFINGWLVQQAKTRGMAAPLNQQLLEQLSR